MALDYAAFITIVQEEAHAPADVAERAARATLETLGERISGGEARDIAAQLPEPLRPVIVHGEQPQRFGIAEFVHRVAEREGVENHDAAEQHARAVFAALGRAVDHKEIHDMAAQLPAGFDPLLGAADPDHFGGAGDGGPEPDRMISARTFFDMVAERAGLDRQQAARATEAALEALADRITRREVEDIATWLPSELQPPLKRGTTKSSGAARPLTLETFLQEIAELQGTDADTARERARAVFSVLRDVVGRRQWRDVYAQVPDDYAIVLGPRP